MVPAFLGILMPELRLRDSHISVRDYYKSLSQYSLLEATHEGAVQAAFGTLLQKCAGQFEWTLIGQYELPRDKKRALRVDGAVLDRWKLPRGYWEAKDNDDDLSAEAKKKITLGYPTDNILFQSPQRALLYQNGKRVIDAQLADPSTLVVVLKAFFEYEPPAYAEWECAAEDFGEHVPKLAKALLELVEKERRESKRFAVAFAQFLQVCRASINPNLAEVAVEKMLVQHLLTERIFRQVFDNPDFSRRNVIAIEIEKVIDALTGRVFTRQKFLGELDRFYLAIEKTARTLDDQREKQHFLNTIYERFFQSFDAKVADTHGIVYTPQPIVRFMVRSVDELLQNEFGRSLGQRDVHIIDPFVGTGNFLVTAMQQIPATQLEHKYANELHANEVMLLPYYIASMNIEQAFEERTGQYQAFEGICLVDTFELAESEQRQLSFMSEANSLRVERQKRAPIYVVLGNPPYNAWQVDENDNNRNRKYRTLDGRVNDTYGRASKATLKNSLSDPYIKAIRWASDRIGSEGIVAFITNSGFIDGLACDGMRKHLSEDFDAIHLLDLGGNVRKNPKLSGSVHNVFGIQVGVAICFLVRKKASGGAPRVAQIRYANVATDWRKEDKFRFLDEMGSIGQLELRTLNPDAQHSWLTTGLRDEYAGFVPLMGAAGARTPRAQCIFAVASNGAKSNNDPYVYDFQKTSLKRRQAEMVETYNGALASWSSARSPNRPLDEVLRAGEGSVKWIRNTKRCLLRGQRAAASSEKLVEAAYRPFTKNWFLFDRIFNEDLYGLPRVFDGSSAPASICVTGVGGEKPFMTLAVSTLPDQHLVGAGSTTQVLPATLADGQSNVTDWALAEFRKTYRDDTIKKMDIFHYVYAMLHHAGYRDRYAANLKRELPRLPYAPKFWAFAEAGERLMGHHLNYEKAPEYPLRRVETPGAKLDWRVNRMRLTKERNAIVYNDFLALVDIPPQAFEYKLGNRSALEWVIEQYQVSEDKRSGIKNDPNRADDQQYIVRLIGQVVTVSLETMRIVAALPAIGAQDAAVATQQRPEATKPLAKGKPGTRGAPAKTSTKKAAEAAKSTRKTARRH
jgi:predicted helicase